MTTLLLLDRADRTGLAWFTNLYTNIVRSVPNQLIVLCIDDQNKNDLIELLADLNPPVYSLDQVCAPWPIGISARSFNNSPHSEVSIDSIKTILREYLLYKSVSSVYFIVPQFVVFRSIFPVILSELSHECSFNFFWPTNTPLKGRVAIYESIYYKHSGIERDYTNFLEGRGQFDHELLGEFCGGYLDFKSLVQSRHFSSLAKANSRNPHFLFLKLKFFMIQGMNNIFYGETIRDSQFVLLLLPKTNHWYTSYANPQLADYSRLIQTIHASLPPSYRLVVRAHPREPYHPQLAQTVKPLHGAQLDNSLSPISAGAASLVVFFGTTAGVEMLLTSAPIIELGHRSLAFDFPSPPVIRAPNFQDIGPAISQALGESISTIRRQAFLASMLLNSVSSRPLDEEFFITRLAPTPSDLVLNLISQHLGTTTSSSPDYSTFSETNVNLGCNEE
jgi:hypothetical protein